MSADTKVRTKTYDVAVYWPYTDVLEDDLALRLIGPVDQNWLRAFELIRQAQTRGLGAWRQNPPPFAEACVYPNENPDPDPDFEEIRGSIYLTGVAPHSDPVDFRDYIGHMLGRINGLASAFVRPSDLSDFAEVLAELG